MRRLSEAEAVAQLRWLREQDVEDRQSWTGYDPIEGWPAAVWVLNAIYELPGAPSNLTHDEVNRIELDAGARESTVVAGVDLDRSLTATGMALGYQRRPGPEWRRLTWRELGMRDGFDFCAVQGRRPDREYIDDPDVIPAAGWPRIFPPGGGSWPANIEPPPEGSLEEASLAALVDVLAEHTPPALAADCVAYVAPTYDETVCYAGDLRDLPTMVSDGDDCDDAVPLWISPSNLWPADRSWLVYTDYDLHATRISGSVALIDAICADGRLDTLRCSGYPAGGSRS